MAQSGDALILLRAEDAADNTGRHFRVGLEETTGEIKELLIRALDR